MMRDTSSRLLSLLAAAALLMIGLAACGNDGGGGGSAMSDQEFCALVESLEAQADDDISDEEALALFAQVARQAPNSQLRRALERFGALAEQFSQLDEDDPAAIGLAFGLMFDPEVLAAMETIDTYFTDVCGFEDSGFTGFGFDDDDAWSDDGFWDDDDDGFWPGDSSIWDDIDTSELHRSVEPFISRYVPENRGSGVGIFMAGGEVVVELTIYDASGEVSTIALCQALESLVESMTDERDVRLDVVIDDVLVAQRRPGGACTDG